MEFLALVCVLEINVVFFSRCFPTKVVISLRISAENCLHLSPTAIFKFHMTELKDRNLISKLATGKNTTCKKISPAFMLVIPTTNPTLPFQSSTLSYHIFLLSKLKVCACREMKARFSRDPRWRLFLACEPSEQFRVFLV